MICIGCGKETNNASIVCNECRIKSLVIKREGILNLVFCPKCHALRVNRRWIYSEKGSEVNRAVAKLYSGKNSITKIEALAGEIDPEITEGTVSAEISVTTDDAKSSFTDTVPYSNKKESCQRCNRSTGSYFEAIVQVRGITGRYSSFIDEAFKNTLKAFNSSEQDITKISKKPEGIDVFFLSYKRAEGFSRKLSGMHMSEYSVNKKLAGRDNGLDLFRYTYLVRLFDLVRGSVLRIGNESFIVLSHNNRALDLLNIDSNKQIKLDSKSFYSLRNEIVDAVPSVEEYSIIFRTGSEVQILSPDGMSTLTVKGSYDSDSVDIVSFHNAYYALPSRSK